ncbi:MAG TPA: RsmE family RNA methyltransferase [Armatimonadota bacterium]
MLSTAEYDGASVVITGEKYHHLVRVRRLRLAERLLGALPDGRVLSLEVSEISAESLRARVLEVQPARGLSPCRITLYQAVLKGEKMELVVQKATELGVDTIAPIFTRRTVPRWEPTAARGRSERWARIADAAAEQCERSLPPRVLPPQELVPTLEGDLPRFLLHEREGRPLPAVAAEYPGLPALALYLGPEGGWDDDEVRLLLDAGAVPIHLGGRILRAETATLTALTLAQYLWGDLGC